MLPVSRSKTYNSFAAPLAARLATPLLAPLLEHLAWLTGKYGYHTTKREFGLDPVHRINRPD